MIVCRNDLEKPRFPESGLVHDVIEFRDPDSINPERTQLSEPNNKLNLISSSNFSETEFKSVKILKIENKYTDFSEPEPKLKNLFKSFTVFRSARDVSILYSAGDLLVNTREHFSAMNEEKKE